MEIGLFIGFISFFLTAVALVIVFLYLYAIVTPYDDYQLIFEGNNTAAALGFGGAKTTQAQKNSRLCGNFRWSIFKKREFII